MDLIFLLFPAAIVNLSEYYISQTLHDKKGHMDGNSFFNRFDTLHDHNEM